MKKQLYFFIFAIMMFIPFYVNADGIDNYYIGDIESKSLIAGFAFNGFNIDVRKYFTNAEPITLNLANKKDFGFTSRQA